MQAAIEAVAEVGNPTIVATLTVVAALLPMLFVSGLMGPYMAPIPANASAAMLFSFFVAMVIAPWLMLRAAPARDGRSMNTTPRTAKAFLAASIAASPRPIVRSRAIGVEVPDRGRRRDLLSCVLFVTKSVTVKLLPFDNKSEMAVVVDLPEGATWRIPSARCSRSPAYRTRQLPEIRSIETYAGTPAPFNFNGLVRHYYVRELPELGELQINLAPRGERTRTSHAIALDLRERLKAVKLPAGHRSPGWSRCRRGRRCWRRCWPKSTAPTLDDAARGRSAR